MLTVPEQKLIKKVLGKQYTGKIIPFLSKKKIVNADGNDFNAESIKKFVGRKRENLTVELAILQLVKITETKQKKLAEKRKEITAKN